MKYEIELPRDGLPTDSECVCVTYRRPKQGEFFLTDSCVWIQVVTELQYPLCRLVAKLKPLKPEYRPFKNASEFEPHRDRWVNTKSTLVNGSHRIIWYNDDYVACVDPVSWLIAFDKYVFEDGSPFGVLA
jgi:hypothetical protein